MVDMDIGELSLDDYIKQAKTVRGGAGGRTRRDGGVQKPKRGRAWDTDKLFGLERGRRPALSGKGVARLSNVPFSVTQQDLQDLFGDYRLTKIVLHHDFRGRSLGTAELHGPSGVIARLNREFKGIEIDGRPLGIQVTESGKLGPMRGAGSPRLRRMGGIQRSRQGGRRSGGGVKGDGRKKFTASELDKELEEYMAGNMAGKDE